MRPRRAGTSMHRGLRIGYYFYRLAFALALLPVRRRSLYRNQRTTDGSDRFTQERRIASVERRKQRRARSS